MDSCPKCESTNVMVGAFVLSCFACGWHYLNKYDCRVCGKPAFNATGCNGVIAYGCRDHPVSLAGVGRISREFST